MIAALARIALTQRIVSIGLGLSLLLGGFWAFVRLPIDAFPDISSTQVQVIVKAPGLSPAEVEQRVTRPIEVAMRGVPELAIMRSQTKYALAIVTLDFDDGTDIYWARQQVSERLGQAWGELPADVDGGLAPITTPLGEAYMFTVEGPLTDQELRTVLDWTIRPRLLSIEGVAEVNSLGGSVRAFEVVPDPGRLAATGLGVADLADAIRGNNRNAGGDRIVVGDEVQLVRTIGRLRGEEDLARTTVATLDGAPIRVADVARVGVGSQVRYGGVTKDGRGEFVQGLVLIRKGANSRTTVDGVRDELERLAPTLPPGVRVVPFYDRTELVERAVAMVRDALLWACGLVVLVLLVFMGNLRSALVVGSILPLAVLATFLLMNVTGASANLMSLGGLAIAIGILVDPAVVIVENAQTRLAHQPSGLDRLHVIYRAVVEVGRPVVAGTAIIVIVFLPIWSLSGLEGRMFAPLAQTISLALIAAVLLALVVIPVLASLVLRGGGEDENWLVRLLKRVHAPLVAWALRRRKLAVGLALGLVAGAGWLFTRIGGEFMPTMNEGTLVMQTTKLPSISLERSLELDGKIQRTMLAFPEVEHVVSRVGSDELRLDPMGLHETDHYLVTKPRDEWRFEDEPELVAALRAQLEETLPGVEYGFTQPIEMRTAEMITGVRAALAIKLSGPDLVELEQLSAAIESVVRETPGAVDVVRSPLSGQTYLEVRMQHAAMARFGVDAEDLNELIETAVGGRAVSEIIEDERRTPVVLRFPVTARDTPRALGELLVASPSGARLPLRMLADIVEADGPVVIEREQGQRQVVIQANVEQRDIVGLVDDLRANITAQVPLPPGYHLEFGGQFENQQRAARRLALVVPAAVLLIFLILFSTFGSLQQAGLVLLNVPFALIGGIAGLYVSGLYLSVPASVGFIALFGTAILNGIVMVSTFNQLRESGHSLLDAVRDGAARRLRPVLVTAFTTGLGLVPLLLATGPGSEIQRPLAVVVLGGLATSTALTLVLLPSLYAWLEGRAAARLATP